MFARTVCDCQQCQRCCREQPGFVIPGQLRQIADYLKVSMAELREKFWASPGGIVQDSRTGRQFRIGTITPKFDKRKKRCVFLTDEGKCSIHPVAPFGCAQFDTHMNKFEAQRRSIWSLQLIAGNTEYAAERKQLTFAESWKPRGY